MLALALLLGVVLGIVAIIAFINLPAETQWRRYRKGWRRKRHGRWDYTEDREAMLRG